jgi:hypothetical protein
MRQGDLSDAELWPPGVPEYLCFPSLPTDSEALPPRESEPLFLDAHIPDNDGPLEPCHAPVSGRAAVAVELFSEAGPVLGEPGATRHPSRAGENTAASAAARSQESRTVAEPALVRGSPVQQPRAGGHCARVLSGNTVRS